MPPRRSPPRPPERTRRWTRTLAFTFDPAPPGLATPFTSRIEPEFAIDTVRVQGVAVVPEPGGTFLVGTGLALVGLAAAR